MFCQRRLEVFCTPKIYPLLTGSPKIQVILPFQDTVTMDITALTDNAPKRLVELKIIIRTSDII